MFTDENELHAAFSMTWSYDTLNRWTGYCDLDIWRVGGNWKAKQLFRERCLGNQRSIENPTGNVTDFFVIENTPDVAPPQLFPFRLFRLFCTGAIRDNGHYGNRR